jgi:hypothetical protein
LFDVNYYTTYKEIKKLKNEEKEEEKKEEEKDQKLKDDKINDKIKEFTGFYPTHLPDKIVKVEYIFNSIKNSIFLFDVNYYTTYKEIKKLKNEEKEEEKKEENKEMDLANKEKENDDIK